MLALCAAALATGGSAQASVTFEPPLPFVDATPLAGADLDEDGYADVVTASGPNLRIYYAPGTGVLAGETFATGGTGLPDVVVADFDGDTFHDLATANFLSGDVSILRGDGTGDFSAPETFSTGGSPVDLVSGDFDGDPHRDLAVSVRPSGGGAGQLAVLPGDGTGSFGPPVAHPTGEEPGEVALGDFDGDGRDDLAVELDGTAEVELLFGQDPDAGGQVFEDPVPVSATGTGNKRLTVGDLNGDESADLGILSGASLTLAIVLGDPSRSFSPLPQNPFTHPARDLDFADLDGDGLDDLLVTADDPSTARHELVAGIGDGEGGFTFGGSFPAGDRPTHLLALHLNGDQEIDVVTSDGVVLGSALTFEPDFVEFPARRVGSLGGPESVLVQNSGTVPYQVEATGFLSGGSGEFAIASDSCAGSTLAVGQACSMSVSFGAGALGVHEDALVVETDAEVYGVGLLGEVHAVPSVGATPPSLVFPDALAIGVPTRASVELTNQGDANMTIGHLTLTGAAAAVFSPSIDGCGGQPLAPGASCSISLTFSPTRAGAHAAVLLVAHDGAGGSLSVPLSGTGTAPFTVSRGAVDFGAVQEGDVARQAITVQLTPASPGSALLVGLRNVEATVSGTDASAFGSSGCLLRPPRSCTLQLQFSPIVVRPHAAELTIATGGYRVVVPLFGTGAASPTPNVSAALRARLRAGLRAWRRGGRAAALRRGLTVTGVRTAVHGALRLTVRKTRGPVLARGSAQARPGVPTRVRGRLTKAGRRALGAGRPVRVLATLRLTATRDRRVSRAQATVTLR